MPNRSKIQTPQHQYATAGFYGNVNFMRSLSLSLGILSHSLHKSIEALHILMMIGFCAFDVLWEKLQSFLKRRFVIPDGAADIVYRLGADFLRRIV